MGNAFTHGDIVKWKPEFAGKDELDDAFVVLEPADDGRCLIRPVVWNYGPIVPTMLTKMSYLAKA